MWVVKPGPLWSKWTSVVVHLLLITPTSRKHSVLSKERRHIPPLGPAQLLWLFIHKAILRRITSRRNGARGPLVLGPFRRTWTCYRGQSHRSGQANKKNLWNSYQKILDCSFDCSRIKFTLIHNCYMIVLSIDHLSIIFSGKNWKMSSTWWKKANIVPHDEVFDSSYPRHSSIISWLGTHGVRRWIIRLFDLLW